VANGEEMISSQVHVKERRSGKVLVFACAEENRGMWRDSVGFGTEGEDVKNCPMLSLYFVRLHLRTCECAQLEK